MTYLQQEIRALFQEAQLLGSFERVLPFGMRVSYCCDLCGSFMHDTGRHRSKEEKAAAQKRYEQKAYTTRRKYKTAWEAKRHLTETIERLRKGERPKKWGRVWRQAAKICGIEIVRGT